MENIKQARKHRDNSALESGEIISRPSVALQRGADKTCMETPRIEWRGEVRMETTGGRKNIESVPFSYVCPGELEYYAKVSTRLEQAWVCIGFGDDDSDTGDEDAMMPWCAERR